MTPLGLVAMVGFFATAFVMITFTFFDPYGLEKQKRQAKNIPISKTETLKSEHVK